MYITFLVICGLLTLVTLILGFKDLWILSLLPLSLSPLLLTLSGLVTTNLTMWIVATLVLTSLPLIILKDYNNNSTTFMSTMTILCATCAAEIILLMLQVLGCDIITLFSTLSLVTWSSILYTLLRKHYDHIRNTLHTTLRYNSFKVCARQNYQNTRLVSTQENKK